VLQGGHELCRIEGFDRRKAVSELKVSIEAEAGLVPALTRLINPESGVGLQDHLTLEDMGMPSEQALAAGVIQLHAQKLKKVVVADELQIAPGEVTDSKLAELCDSIRDYPPDILVLWGCRRVTNISCLVQLSTISHLDISSCNLGAQGGFHLASIIKDMGALTSLNMSKNRIKGAEAGKALGDALAGNTVLKELDLSGDEHYANMDIGFMKAFTPGLSENGAMLKLDVSNNALCADGAKVLAETLMGNQVLTEINIANNCLGKKTASLFFEDADMSGIAALADAIPGMGALIKLDISSNHIGAEQEGGLQRICAAGSIELAK
jgi:hypothetical protein